MPAADLTTSVGTFLTLREPLWIASAHYSQDTSALAAWRDQGVAPAALTLKTSQRTPPVENGKTTLRFATYPHFSRFGRSYYCDGPKHKEFLPYAATASLLTQAREILPSSKIGVSVLAHADENYAELAGQVPEAAFAELNLKYSFRIKSESAALLAIATSQFEATFTEIERFLAAFAGKPVFVKLSRELRWLPETAELTRLVQALSNHGKAGLIVANSEKMNVPPFMVAGQEKSLSGGVMCGEHLFDDTINFVTGICKTAEPAGVPVIASGGLIDPEQVCTALMAGAAAVQLCTAFVYLKLPYYNTLRLNLQSRIEMQGLTTLSAFVDRLRHTGAAAIYSMPFQYFETFWSPETQKRLLIDVRQSQRMDVVVMSGRTLIDRWSDTLRKRRESGRGLRLLMPNPDGAMFQAIQKAWGLSDIAIKERQARIHDARSQCVAIWQKQGNETTGNGPQTEAAGTPAPDSTGNLQIYFHDQCPFNALYLFDDKVYLTSYPFTRIGEVDVPVYVFFAGSKEYQRLSEAFEQLVVFGQQAGDRPLESPGKVT
jgi:dihydroorotate dehydrogenase